VTPPSSVPMTSRSAFSCAARPASWSIQVR